jgi:predicted AAA+ superfamily ATPase
MNYVPRVQEKTLRTFVQEKAPHKDVLLVEGARQTGKTTLVEHVLSAVKRKSVAINFERRPALLSKIDSCADFSDFTSLLEDACGFDPSANHVLFIDESQESMKLGGFVRFMKEEWGNATVILSGSTLTRLFRPDVRYPVGRVRRLTVTPFSFTEFLVALGSGRDAAAVREEFRKTTPSRHLHLLELYDRDLAIGGLPRIVADYADGKDRAGRTGEIVADYERDFIRIFGEDTLSIVKACFRSVAHFTGSASKNTTVVPSPGTTMNNKINGIFTRLEEWKLVLKSPQSGPSPEHSYGYLPKRYLFDTGLLRHFRETSLPSLKLLGDARPGVRTVIGGTIENQVAIDLSRRGAGLSGWKKTPSGMEIDFIIRENGGTMPCECKAALKIKGQHLRGLADYMETYKVKRGVIVSGAPYCVIPVRNGEIVNMPLYAAEFLPPPACGNREITGKRMDHE